MEFKGRIDIFWYLLPLALTGLGYWLFYQTSVWQVLLPLLVPIVITSAFIVRNKVLITVEGKLKIQLGLFSKSIELSNVKAMATTNSVWSSWSTSTRRIVVYYDKYNSVMIGVKNENEFLQYVQSNYPHIAIKKDR